MNDTAPIFQETMTEPQRELYIKEIMSILKNKKDIETIKRIYTFVKYIN